MAAAGPRGRPSGPGAAPDGRRGAARPPEGPRGRPRWPPRCPTEAPEGLLFRRHRGENGENRRKKRKLEIWGRRGRQLGARVVVVLCVFIRQRRCAAFLLHERADAPLEGASMPSVTALEGTSEETT